MSRSMLRTALMALAALGCAGTVRAQPTPNPYDKPGPNVVRGYSGQVCMVFRPVELKPGTPVILWGNGTGTQPMDYQALLSRLASYGFVIGAANTPNAGSGAEMLGCLGWLTAENAREGSVYFGKLDLSKVGATGHSQGGRGALMAGRDARVITTAPLMPAARNADPAAVAGALHGPLLLLSGGMDVLAPPETSQKPLFEAATRPVVWLTERDAGHLAAMRDGGPYAAALTAWFLYRLDGDRQAAAQFEGEHCGYCTAADWSVQRKGGE